MAADRYAEYQALGQHAFVYMDIVVALKPLGRLVFELYTDVCPATAAHFKALCASGSYRESAIHRVQRGGWIQGGDLVDGSGAHNGERHRHPPLSSLRQRLFFPPPGEAALPDENFAVPHGGRGVLSLANTGRNTGGTQFVVSLQAVPWMPGKYVACGCEAWPPPAFSLGGSRPSRLVGPAGLRCRQLVEGEAVLAAMAALPLLNERPDPPCVVSACGLLP